MLKNKIAYSKAHLKYLSKLRLHSSIIILSIIGVLVFFTIFWEIAAKLQWIDPFIFSSPSRIFKTFVQLYSNGTLMKHVWQSTYETILGFALGSIIGMIIATILWWSPLLKSIFEPYLVVINSLPKIALGPIIIVWVGTGAASIITMAILISFIITALNMLTAFCETDKDKLLLMRTMRAKKYQIFTKLVFPSNTVSLLNTLKINVGMSWVGTIMGEYLVSKAGLGYLIVYGGQVFKLDLVMTCTIALCILAGGMYGLVALIELIARRHR
ncbi:MAG: ABC transporter permease [Clostridia bacterium]